jgi:hypothetical protein
MNKQEIMSKIANMENELAQMKEVVNEQTATITDDLITKIAKAVAKMIDDSNTRYVKDYDISLSDKKIELDTIEFEEWDLETDIENKIQEILKKEGVMAEA